MKKKIIDDISLLDEMMQDQSSIYKIDPHWKSYESLNILKIKSYNLEKYMQFPNSFGVDSSQKYSYVGNFFNKMYFGFLRRIKKLLRINATFSPMFKMINFFNYTKEDIKATRRNYSTLILRIINSLPGSEKLLEIDDDLIWNPVDIIKLRNKKYSINFVKYFYEFLMINKFADFEKSNFFLEIGGGYGGFTEILKKTCPGIKIIYIDIAPQLYVAEQYLKSIFPNKVLGFRETKKMDFITQDSFLNYDVLILPPWDIKKIKNNLIDNFYNAASFQEMQKDTVKNYCIELGKIVKNNIILYEQREGNGAIVDPVTRSDYINYMKLNKFKLIDEKVSFYGGHLRNDPSAPLSHSDFYFFSKID